VSALPRPPLLGAAVAVGLVLAGCGSGPATASKSPAVPVQARQIAGLGPVLTTAAGFTLYVYAPDRQRTVTCTGECASDWPPLTAAPGARPQPGPGINPKLLGSVADPAGGRVITYNHWPLYRDRDDTIAGEINGQAQSDDGGRWYTIAPTGRPVTRPVAIP